MPKKQKIIRSVADYLNTINSLDYEDLRACIDADTVWDDGQTRRNPIAYELFATHEHLDFVKEEIFKFSGQVLDSDTFATTAQKIEEIWRSRLPKLFPGHEFAIINDSDLRQIAFCRKRTGFSDDPDEIITYLTHRDHYVRWNALLSASLYPHPKLIPHLLMSLDDDDVYNTLTAISALGSSRDKSVIDVLGKRFLILVAGSGNKLSINDFFAYDLFNALIKLGQKGYNLVFNIFKNYRELEIGTLEDICELMGKFGRPEALEILLEIYLNDRVSSDAALGGLISQETAVLPKILHLLSSEDVYLRQRAMWFIANTYNIDLRSYLLNGLHDTNSGVREAAVFGLGRFCHATRKEILLKAAYDRAVNVRLRAIEGLGSLFESTLLPVFRSLCTDKSPKVRSEAMRAVAVMESRQGLKFLNSLFETSTNPDRLRIVKALYSYTGDISQLKPLLAKALACDDKRVVQETNDLIELLQ